MKKVNEYTAILSRHTSVQMPQGSKVLHVAVEECSLCLWALVEHDDSKHPLRAYDLQIVGTGHGLSNDIDHMEHVGTLFIRGLTFHVFIRERIDTEVARLPDYDSNRSRRCLAEI